MSRTEQYLNYILTKDGDIPKEPLSRVEQYLHKIATGEGDIPKEPLSRIEQYLNAILNNGAMGGGSQEIKPVYLYNEGDLCTDVTNGWGNMITFPSSYWSGGSYHGTFNANHILLSTTKTRSGVSVITTNKIDTTKFKRLYIECTPVACASSAGMLVCELATGFEEGGIVKQLNLKNNLGERAIYSSDISNINDFYYARVCITSNGTSGKSELLVHKIWLGDLPE